MKNQDFMNEFDDSGESAEISQRVNKISLVLEMLKSNIDIGDFNEELNYIGILFRDLAKSKNFNEKLEHKMIIIEQKIKNSQERHEKKLQSKMAKNYMAKVFNSKQGHVKKTKSSILYRYRYAIAEMKESLTMREIADFFNEKYGDWIKEEAFADFSTQDISIHEKRMKSRS